MKVKDALDYLSNYPPEMDIVFYTSSSCPELTWLSDYMDETDSFVCVDIGDIGD
ncbi:MAG: hypothetical protein KGI08_04590 [Thaumarchaeota archaeon]|nr:hypothetical protein [Nitrososphaerota archaeon]